MSLEHIEIGSFAPPQPRSETTDVLRIVSWNINRGSCFDLILDFLDSTNAGLILLQECDSNALRSECRNIAKELAERLKMNYVFGIEFRELSQGTGNTAGYHGQATLSREPLFNPRILRFSHQSGFWKPRWFIPNTPRMQRRLGGRMALVTEIVLDGRGMAVYNLHLESRGGDSLRSRQLSEVFVDAQQYGTETPVVLAGDFNFDVSRSACAIQQAGYRSLFAKESQDTTTKISRLRNSRAIDWILIRGPLASHGACVHTLASGSDHYPLSLIVRPT